MTEDHTADNLANVIKDLLQEWNIENDKISSFSTDSGANIVKCIELLNIPRVPQSVAFSENYTTPSSPNVFSEYVPPSSSSNQPVKITQDLLDHIVAKLELSQRKSEILASILNSNNLLAQGTKARLDGLVDRLDRMIKDNCELRKQNQELSERVLQLEGQRFVGAGQEELIYEVNERMRRASNLVVFNLKESAKESKSEREDENREKL
ncbi:unnamed protein product [Brassicogethes aeneus]|uniref:Uncharacterized protein n=1 Tax=Brassicogethes aeneus TaxID=1431903 RepID=A0A9P0BGY3_BRAAE|nr:unnamed protein product [Brassicogethes aeneus]